MRVPGWEGMRPEELGEEIEALVRNRHSDRIQVAERRRLSAYAPREPLPAEVLTAARLVLHIFRSLTLPERLAWLPWIAAAFFVSARRRPEGSRPRQFLENEGPRGRCVPLAPLAVRPTADAAWGQRVQPMGFTPNCDKLWGPHSSGVD